MKIHSPLLFIFTRMIHSFIELENVRFFAYHGVMPQEALVGNHFEVSLRIGVDFRHAIETDEIENTVHYGELYETIKEQMMIRSKLIEHVAGRIIEAIQARWTNIETIELRLSKINPPIEGEVPKATVVLHWTKKMSQ